MCSCSINRPALILPIYIASIFSPESWASSSASAPASIKSSRNPLDHFSPKVVHPTPITATGLIIASRSSPCVLHTGHSQGKWDLSITALPLERHHDGTYQTGLHQ